VCKEGSGEGEGGAAACRGGRACSGGSESTGRGGGTKAKRVDEPNDAVRHDPRVAFVPSIVGGNGNPYDDV
jgi:hypothetical protein